MTPMQKAKEMGADLTPCIGDWMWAAFTEDVDAESYIEWLQQMGHEHRGMWNGRRGANGQYQFSVRFRNKVGQ